MRKGSAFVLIASVVLTAVMLVPSLQAYNNGVPSSNLEYDCGGSGTCHDDQSASVITMSASNVTPAAGGTVQLWVNVSGGEADGTQLGVMVVCATTLTNSLPSADGWTIVSDPSGTTAFNYYQVDSYVGSASLMWTLTAPDTLGIHMLFAREMHGGGDTYANDYSTGLMFTVTDYSDGGDDGGTTDDVPTVVITAPSNSATVSGEVTVNVNIVSADGITSVTLKVDGVAVGVATEGPFTWVIDTTNMTEGGHVVSVTVVDGTGDSVSREIAVFVDNESEVVSMLEWVVTIGAGTVAIICVTGMLVVLALYIRKRVVERRSR